jgi:hypothetical protein
MIKCKVFIYSGNGFLDQHVSVEITLPSVPYVGSYLQMSDLKDELELKAKSSPEIAQKYWPKWFSGSSKHSEKIELENLKDLSFADAMYVSSVTFKANDEYLYIEMTDNDITGLTAKEK